MPVEEQRKLRKRNSRTWTKLPTNLENGLLKLVQSLEQKREKGDWIDTLIVKESNAVYGDAVGME